MIILLIIFGYIFIGTLTYNVCLHLDIGVEHYEYVNDLTIGAVVISLFWFISVPVMICYYVSKLFLNWVLEQLKSK